MGKGKLGRWWGTGAMVCLLVSAGVAAQGQPMGSDSPFNERGGPNQAILTYLHQQNQQALLDAGLAEQRSTNAAVKELATQIIDAHTAADAKILAYAREEGMDLEAIRAGAGAQAHGAVSRVDLEAAPAYRFDHDFASKMVADHQAAYDEMQKAAALARGPRLRALLRDLTPMMLAQQASAMSLVAALPAPANTSLTLPAPTNPVLPLPPQPLGAGAMQPGAEPGR